MSERSTVTTRSKLRKLEAEISKRRAMEVDSGVPSELAPGSPSIAPTISSVPAPVIPLPPFRAIKTIGTFSTKFKQFLLLKQRESER